MERIKLYLRESYNELLHKVTWPSWANLQSSTIVVVVAAVILSLLILVMDLASKQITDLIYGL
ncbi:MAG: preprotein translocase subunit SecE [Saprospiraceae bacterium]|jgi:preprotein translocase subunit SecE|nr:preprotein translocase subunit SecE [Saprospiraceae bacterium]